MLCAEMTSSRVSRDMTTVAFVTGSTPSFKSSFTQDDLSVIGRQSAFITIDRWMARWRATYQIVHVGYDAAGTGSFSKGHVQFVE